MLGLEPAGRSTKGVSLLRTLCWVAVHEQKAGATLRCLRVGKESLGREITILSVCSLVDIVIR